MVGFELRESLMLKSFQEAIVLSVAPTMALACGARGHSVVAQIADDRLTSNARLHVQAILAAEIKPGMVGAASWADDENELKRRPTSPMQTVRMKLEGAFYNKAVDCPDDRCLVEAMKREIATLSDPYPSSPMHDQILALKNLIHFVGNVHQPLYTMKYIGHQRVIFNGIDTTLHPRRCGP